MITKEGLYVGKQIVFNDGFREPEHGIVSSWNDKIVFCRFFIDDGYSLDLRTVVNSEGCAYADLSEHEFMSEHDEKYVLDTFRQSPEKYGWVEQGAESKNGL